MIDGQAAGHDFVDGKCACGVYLADLEYVTREHIGSENITHIRDRANAYEVDSIMNLVAKMREQMSRVFGW